MTPIHALILGLVQGLTEFLPVSSSAHLLLVPWLFGWQTPGLTFDVALHWGTLTAVLLYYWSDVGRLVRGFVGSFQGKREPENRLPWLIALATVPGVIAGFVLDEVIETTLRSPYIAAANLALVGLVLFAVDHKKNNTRQMDHVTWKDALLIGGLQAMALVPGVSRSGITISAALLLGFERSSAVRFSFLMALPITAGAGILKSGYLVGHLASAEVWCGIGAAAISGLAAIHLLVTYVRSRSFTPFVVYRLALAVVVAVVASRL